MQLLLLPKGFSCILLLSAPWDARHIQHLNSSDFELCTPHWRRATAVAKSKASSSDEWVVVHHSCLCFWCCPPIRELSLAVYWAAVWFVISALICLCNSTHHLISVLVRHQPPCQFVFSSHWFFQIFYYLASYGCLHLLAKWEHKLNSPSPTPISTATRNW